MATNEVFYIFSANFYVLTICVDRQNLVAYLFNFIKKTQIKNQFECKKSGFGGSKKINPFYFPQAKLLWENISKSQKNLDFYVDFLYFVSKTFWVRGFAYFFSYITCTSDGFYFLQWPIPRCSLPRRGERSLGSGNHKINLFIFLNFKFSEFQNFVGMHRWKS